MSKVVFENLKTEINSHPIEPYKTLIITILDQLIWKKKKTLLLREPTGIIELEIMSLDYWINSSSAWS